MSFRTAIEGFFEKIGSFFEHLFGKVGDAVQSVLENIGPLVQEATPIIEDLSSVITGVDMQTPNAVLDKIEGYLNTTIKDTNVVSQFISTNENVPLVNLISNAATLVLGHTTGTANVVLKDLQLAVQLAYNAFSHSNPGTTGTQTVAALTTAVAKKA